MYKTIFEVIDQHNLTKKLTSLEKEDLSHELFMEIINKKAEDSEIKLVIGKPRYRQRKR